MRQWRRTGRPRGTGACCSGIAAVAIAATTTHGRCARSVSVTKPAGAEASGAGTVYSWSVERRGKPPYIIAFVTLAEGPTILSNLVDCEPEAVSIGQHVTLAFETREEQPVPVFRPA